MASELNDLCDIEGEKSLLLAISMLDNLAADSAIIRIRRDFFFVHQHQEIFDTIKKLVDNGHDPTINTISSDMLSNGLGVDALQNIAMGEPAMSIDFTVDKLEEWHKKRALLKEMKKSLIDIQSSGSFSIANRLTTVIDDINTHSIDSFRTYREIKQEISQLPPIDKIKTGVPFIDVKLKGGIEEGQLILLMGDPDAGKTILGTQIAKYVSNNHKVILFPLEFRDRAFIEANTVNEPNFNQDNFYMESNFNDILDIEHKLKAFARIGGKLAVIDSQMSVTNMSNKGTSEERETEKFFVLQRVCIRTGMDIIFLCQQGKEDTRSSVVTPKGSKNGAHFAHQIWYIKTPKVTFDERGENKNKLLRDFLLYKNKQNGNQYSKPIALDPVRLEFSGRHYDVDDSRGKKRSVSIEYEYVSKDKKE